MKVGKVKIACILLFPVSEFCDAKGIQQFVRFKLFLKVRNIVAILKLRWHWNILFLLLLLLKRMSKIWIKMHTGVKSRIWKKLIVCLVCCARRERRGADFCSNSSRIAK